MRRWCLVGIVVTASAASACREATEPFTALDRPDESEQLPRQLTFAAADDRSPHWDVAGTTVRYSTQGFPPFVPAPGLLVRVPAGGGGSEAVLPSLQFPGGSLDRFSAPVASESGDKLAWVDLRSLLTENVCPGTVVMCLPEGTGLGPRLAEVRIRVTALPHTAGASEATTAVPVDGVESLPPGSGLTRFATRVHPFQALFDIEQSAVFRPTWSPAGDRIVFSDGLRLLMWGIDGSTPTAIPGTGDGVQAAWSPDGSWIAYTRLVRGQPIEMACTHSVPLGPVCNQERIEWPIVRRVLMLIRPDGSSAMELGSGDDPAWTPDSGRLVFRRDGRLWVSDLDGSSAVEVPGTAGGREPTVSPDGSMVAYARIDPTSMTHDLWVAALPGGGP